MARKKTATPFRKAQRLLAGAVCMAALGAVSDAMAQSGAADLSSGGRGWRIDCRLPNGKPCDTNTELLKVPGDTGPGPILQDANFPYGHGQNKRLADTKNPILQPWAKAKMDAEVKRILAGGLPFVPTSRCWPGGVPGIHLYTGNVFFLQTKDQVWIMQERDGARRVYMNVPHSKNPGYSWYGESVGHYEGGDTLVVDTIGLDDKGPLDRLGTPHTKQLHVVERYSLVDGGKRMRVTFHIDDPGAFTQPWNAMVEYARASERGHPEIPVDWEEYACNENSTDYFIDDKDLVPVPSATKRDF